MGKSQVTGEITIEPEREREDEWVYVVDDNNIIVGKERLSIVHRDKLPHRAVTAFVFNQQGELYVIQRSHDETKNKGKWQAAPSGHAQIRDQSGRRTAIREGKEELGIDISQSLDFAFQQKVFSAEQKEFFDLFTCTVTDEQATAISTNEEAAQGRFMKVDEILAEIVSDSSQFRDAFVTMFLWYCLENNLPAQQPVSYRIMRGLKRKKS